MGGKSNLLDALRFLYEAWFPQPGTYGPVHAVSQRGGIDEVAWKGGQDKVLSIAVSFAEPSQAERSFEYSIEVTGSSTGYINVQEERLLLHDGEREHSLIVRDNTGRWLVNMDGQRLVNVDADGSAMEFAPKNWDGYRPKVFVQNWRFYQLVPSLMKQVNAVTAGGALEPHGQNLSAWLMWLQTRSADSFSRIEEAVRDVFPEVRLLLTWPTQQGTVYLASEEHGLARSTPLFQMSDGELAFITFVSLTCAPDELGRTLFVIVEPENHFIPDCWRRWSHCYGRSSTSYRIATPDCRRLYSLLTRRIYSIRSNSMKFCGWRRSRAKQRWSAQATRTICGS